MFFFFFIQNLAYVKGVNEENVFYAFIYKILPLIVCGSYMIIRPYTVRGIMCNNI